MARPNFLDLPAELRQQIASETMYIRIGRTQFRVTTPLCGVCKQLEADIDEMRNSWLPSATTDTSILLSYTKTTNALSCLSIHYNQLARSSGRSWPGILHVRLRYWSNIIPPQRSSRTKSPLVLLKVVDLGTFRAHGLPTSVQTFQLDLDMPPAIVKYLEDYWPGGSRLQGPPIYELQQRFWWQNVASGVEKVYAFMKSHHGWKEEGSRGRKYITVDGQEIEFKVIGKMPESQAEAMVHGENAKWWKLVNRPSTMILDGYLNDLKSMRLKMLEKAIAQAKLSEQAPRKRKREDEMNPRLKKRKTKLGRPGQS
ncbi:uncharacterized protein BDZ99DRAFT_467349 [Mytilinidion resinicola]|uniref:Uncharacterized protein n=1 Tax=Mytilinidion resinicola TaxID=574789 RepID=A0A6A6Y960_9PEZI|nr:uncharacterized protein BDZ99DRAFT_467349 [Mytilinidion resinicola]KAF2804665.1 hypothetical protein BDZ99DRAFT_467349 [Mytilinidion resinicola]